MPFSFSPRLIAIFAASMLTVSGLLQGSTFGQDGKTGDDQQARQFAPINFQGKAEFEISNPDEVPPQLARAIEQEQCRYKDRMKKYPLHFVESNSPRAEL
jgi:hypothetical protein